MREHIQNEAISVQASRKNRRMSRVAFDEKFDPSTSSYLPWEEQPGDPIRHPFWLMRTIKNTINHGGYITADVFVPKIVWTQFGAKFHAMSTKIAAFEELMILFSREISPLETEFPRDIHSVEEAVTSFSIFHKGLVAIQNNLAKPFPYIKEVPIPGQHSPPNPTTQVCIY